MTEIERDIPSRENDDAANEAPADVGRSLGRAVFWLAVVALAYAMGCAIGVFIGIVNYRIEAVAPPSSLQSRAVRLVQIFILEKGSLVCAFLVLARALWRYTRSLDRAYAEGASVDPEKLATEQFRCWQAAMWVALLYAGWEITAAFV